MPKTETPERDLATAILRQAWRDLASPDPWVQHEARAFWNNEAAVSFWDETLNLDGALHRHVAARVQTRETQDPRPQQLVLFAEVLS